MQYIMKLLVYISHFQCKKYRSEFTEERKAVYEEKLEASEIFKDKKALYPSRYLQFSGADYCLIHVHFYFLIGRILNV